MRVGLTFSQVHGDEVGIVGAMGNANAAYFGIAVFEIGKADGSGKYYREDFYLVHAVDVSSAEAKAERCAREQEHPVMPGHDRSYVRLVRLIDVAPALQDPTGEVVDLYSRHFASLETYSEFEMMLAGRDPLSS